MSAIWVSGAVANKLFHGGEAWTRLSYVVGIAKLGFDVYFVEQIDPANCMDEAGAAAPVERSANLAYFQRIMERFGLTERSSLIDASTERAHGTSYDALLEMAGSVDLLINISGHLSLPRLTERIRRKAYIDLDPGFTQIWHAEGSLGDAIERHDFHFTVGEKIGLPSCPIPTSGIRWRPTRQPVVLDHWPVSEDGDPRRFTTIANWRGPFGPVVLGGKTLGLKVHQFRKYVETPLRVDATFELALNIHPNDRRDLEMLERNSWRLVDPKGVARDPESFRRYVQTSGGEFSAAQHIYVETNSGWFSDRTVRYLASGKPVLVENTGWTDLHPVRQGLIAFSSPEEAVEGARDILENYPAHARAARQIAETTFESGRVLERLLAEVQLAPDPLAEDAVAATLARVEPRSLPHRIGL